MKHLLAPVPAVHLPSALEKFEEKGRVAFGSNAFELLDSIRDKDVSVWVVASSTDAPSGGVTGIEIGKIVIRANLVAITEADRRGQHPDPSLRPISTLTDDKSYWAMFWEIGDLQKLEQPIPIDKFTTVHGSILSRTPQGPTLVLRPEITQA